MGIVAGIYKDVFEHRAELFDVPHAPITPYQPTGMAVDDGTNVIDTDLKSFCRDNSITLNYHVLQCVLAGHWQHYTFVLSAAAKQAITEYCGYFEFCKTDPPQTPSTTTSTFNPVEKYNRFGEIVECYPNTGVAAKANDLTPSALRRKLASWDDNCRHQFRYALPQTDQPNLFPIEQWRDNMLINRFATLEEAATTLECGKSTIDR